MTERRTMADRNAHADRVECWRLDGALGEVELLCADFRRQCFAPHFHDDYTFGLVTRGANRFRYGRQRLVAPVGTLCLAMPGEIHTGEAVDGGWSYWTVHIPVAVLARLGGPHAERAADPPSFARAVIDDPAAARRFAAFFAASRDTALPTLAHEERLADAVGHLVRRHGQRRRPRDRGARNHAALAARVRDVLADRFAEPLTLADLETLTGADRFRLIRAFRTTYGLPPHAWQVQVRLARARAMIRSGSPIAAAAAATGFADQSHLTRLFKRSFGHTPGLVASGRSAPA
jgi:AraC-like DNA-binding protein